MSGQPTGATVTEDGDAREIRQVLPTRSSPVWRSRPFQRAFRRSSTVRRRPAPRWTQRDRHVLPAHLPEQALRQGLHPRRIDLDDRPLGLPAR